MNWWAVAAAGFNVLAAALWFWSAFAAKAADHFPIVVVRANGPLGTPMMPLGAEYVGSGYSVDLDQLGKSLKRQSAISGAAAICAALSAVFGAASLV